MTNHQNRVEVSLTFLRLDRYFDNEQCCNDYEHASYGVWRAVCFNIRSIFFHSITLNFIRWERGSFDLEYSVFFLCLLLL